MNSKEKTMSKLKIKLEVVNKTLVYAVLDQCKSVTREDGEPSLYFKAKNGVEIVSAGAPFISYDLIRLRGGDSEEYNEDVDTLQFESHKGALEAKEKALEALTEWANSGYFGGDKDDSPRANNIYEF